MKRPETELERTGKRCAAVVADWAPRKPDGNVDGLRLLADFAWALGAHIDFTLGPAQGIVTEGGDATAAPGASDSERVEPGPEGAP